MSVRKKDGKMQIRVTSDQAKRFMTAADREGFSASEWMRRLAERRTRELAAGVARPGDLPPAA